MNFRQDKSIYLQIADHIMENILSEKWKEEERIPSVRDLAVEIEVNPNTVVNTYSFLQEKGIIYNKRGIGYFVSEHAVKKTVQLEKESFFNDQLPQVFKTMLLLDISLSELKTKFDVYKNKIGASNKKQTDSKGKS